MTISISAAPISTRNPNDIFYQLQNLDKLISQEYMFESGSYIDYEMYPVHKDLLSGKLVKSTASNIYPLPVTADYYVAEENISNDNYLKLTIDNSTNIKQYYINQYAREFESIINDLFYNNPDILEIAKKYNKQNPEDYIRSFQSLFLKLVNKMSALKGTFFLIEMILKLYSQFLGKELISFMEDPINPFIYRITSNLPVETWRNNIRPLVHPMGWLDNYNIVDSKLTDLIIQPFDKNTKILSTFKLKTISYIDAEKYFLNQSPYSLLIPPSSHGDVNYYNNPDVKLNFIPPAVSGTAYFIPSSGDYFGNLRYIKNIDGNSLGEVKIHDNYQRNFEKLGRLGVPFDDIRILNYKKFNLKPGKDVIVNNNTIEYDNIDDYEFLHPKNISFTYNQDLENNNVVLTITYPKPGFALQYRWDVYNKNKLLQSDITFFNKYTLNLTDLANKFNHLSYEYLKNISIELTLIYDKYRKKILKYDLASLIRIKALPLITEEKLWRNNFIGVRMKNILQRGNQQYVTLPNGNYQGIALSSFTSEKNNGTLSFLNYSISGDYYNAFEYNSSVIESITSSGGLAGNLKQTKISDVDREIEFVPVIPSTLEPLFPLISNYRWILKYGNISHGEEAQLIYSKETKHNKVNITLSKIQDIIGNVTIPTNNYKLELFITLNNSSIEYQVDTSYFKFV